MNRPFISDGASASPPSTPGSGSVGYWQDTANVTAWFLHMLTEELWNVIDDAGLTHDHAVVSQLSSAIEQLRFDYLDAFSQDMVPSDDITRSIGSATKALEYLYAQHLVFEAARTRHLVLPGADAQINGANNWGVINMGVSETDPTANSPFLRCDGTGASGRATWRANLPQGAIITGCSFECNLAAVGGSNRASMVRRSLSSPGSATNLRATSPTVGESLSDTTGIETRSLDLDASAAIRTVDNSLYFYEVMFWTTSNATADVYAVDVDYTIDEVDF